MSEGAETFAQWCILELMGHRRAAGLVTEVTIAGRGFLRLDEPAREARPGHPAADARTQFISPEAIYAIHPVSQRVAEAMNAAAMPISYYEIEAAGLAPAADRDEDPDPDNPLGDPPF